MVLREYNREDSAAISGWLGSENEMYKWSAEIFDHFPIGKYELDEHYAPQIKEGRFYPLSAVDEAGNLCGHLTVRYVGEGDDNVRIGYVILKPELRGKGYGKELVSLAIDYAKRLGARRAELLVFENNLSARRCYESLGFKKYDIIDYEIPIGVWKCIKLEMFL